MSSLTFLHWPGHVVRALVVAGTIVLADTVSKVAATSALSDGRRRGPFLLVQNPEFSLGSFSSSHLLMTTMMALGILGLACAFRYALRAHTRAALFLALAIGGSVGNALDRAADGTVTDFFVAGRVVINLADVAVLVGLMGAVVLWRNRAGRGIARSVSSSGPEIG